MQCSDKEVLPLTFKWLGIEQSVPFSRCRLLPMPPNVTIRPEFFHLRRLRQVRRLLGRDVTANLVCAFVLSRLDYGNALLAGLPYATIAPLKRVLNAAVRLVYGTLWHTQAVETSRRSRSYEAANHLLHLQPT